MACKFVQTLDCDECQRCKFCGWNPAVAEKRKQAIRAGRMDKIKLARRLRKYQAEYSKKCFGVLAEAIGGHMTETFLENMSVGVVGYLPKKYLEEIDAVLTKFESEMEAEHGECY